jgi:uncharacterized membrane protein YhaH (DUF805 family)
MNHRSRTAFWYLFLAWSVLEFAISVLKFKSSTWPALPAWIDFIFFALAAVNLLYFAAAHVG